MRTKQQFCYAINLVFFNAGYLYKDYCKVINNKILIELWHFYNEHPNGKVFSYSGDGYSFGTEPTVRQVANWLGEIIEPFIYKFQINKSEVEFAFEKEDLHYTNVFLD